MPADIGPRERGVGRFGVVGVGEEEVARFAEGATGCGLGGHRISCDGVARITEHGSPQSRSAPEGILRDPSRLPRSV
ncbi:hypothetical protein GCM10009816_05810 [Microbacterium aquimaris]